MTFKYQRTMLIFFNPADSGNILNYSINNKFDHTYTQLPSIGIVYYLDRISFTQFAAWKINALRKLN
jgi:hypothetical protein